MKKLSLLYAAVAAMGAGALLPPPRATPSPRTPVPPPPGANAVPLCHKETRQSRRRAERLAKKKDARKEHP